MYSSLLVILIFNALVSYGYDGPIAGNKSISDCFNGDKDKYSDLKMTPVISTSIIYL